MKIITKSDRTRLLVSILLALLLTAGFASALPWVRAKIAPGLFARRKLTAVGSPARRGILLHAGLPPKPRCLGRGNLRHQHRGRLFTGKTGRT